MLSVRGGSLISGDEWPLVGALEMCAAGAIVVDARCGELSKAEAEIQADDCGNQHDDTLTTPMLLLTRL